MSTSKPAWQIYHGVAIPGVHPDDYKVMQPADFYLKLAVTVLHGRATHTLTDQQDDDICAFMGEVWKQLSQQDQDRVNSILINQEHDDE